MIKVLLAVDGSECALHAVAHFLKFAALARDQYEVQLVNVQYPLHGSVSTFIDPAQVKQYHHDEGMRALAQARRLLEQAGVAFSYHLFVGDPAEVIARYGKEQCCDQIVIGSRGLSGVAGVLVGSVATKLIHLSEVPVLLVK